MRKHIYLLTSIILALFLTACNTSDDQPNTEHTKDHVTADSGSNENQDLPENGNVTEEPVEPSDNKTTITYTTNGEERTEETTTVKSNSQGYSIQSLPNFTLTAEEPGKDMLYLTADDSITMRIEYKSTNDSTFDDLVKNTEELMNTISPHVGYEQFDIKEFIQDDIANYTAYKVDLADQVVIAVVFEKEDSLVRLTIFDEKLMDLSDAMIKMGLTIKKAN